MEHMFWICIILLYYIYDGYLRVLKLMATLQPQREQPSAKDNGPPAVTVLVTAFNEVKSIRSKIENIIACDYPAPLLEVLVASDGSTDGTDDVVASMQMDNVTLFRPEQRIGKTDTQNKAIKIAKGEIIVFTDADTRFDRLFLRNIVQRFSDPKVGGVDGHLLFRTKEDSGVSQSQGFYWSYELAVRQLESLQGILAVASGACMAIRRSLFMEMEAEYGEDCIVPLDIVGQGYKMVHAADAIAYDQMECDSRGEFKTRARMTLRNLQGTLSRPDLLNPLKNPLYAFSLWSHKLLRWLSPLFILTATVISFSNIGGIWYLTASSLFFALIYILGILGWAAERFHWRIPIVKTVYSFLLANCGFFAGLLKAAMGQRITAYRHEGPGVDKCAKT